MSADDRVRHDREVAELKEQGYFTNADGIKSTFLTKNHRKLEFEVGTYLPKRAAGAYFCFLNEFWSQNKKVEG